MRDAEHARFEHACVADQSASGFGDQPRTMGAEGCLYGRFNGASVHGQRRAGHGVGRRKAAAQVEQPRTVPVLAQRAEVRTKQARYTAELTTEVSWWSEGGARLELNPAGTTIGSVWVVLPAGEVPVRLQLQEVEPKQRRFRARLRTS